MKTTDVLCQTLQKKCLDILNAMDCVSNMKLLLHGLRNDGWEPLLEEVTKFCDKHEIEIPDMSRKCVILPKFLSSCSLLFCAKKLNLITYLFNFAGILM